jgi:hypothetical protein
MCFRIKDSELDDSISGISSTLSFVMIIILNMHVPKLVYAFKQSGGLQFVHKAGRAEENKRI